MPNPELAILTTLDPRESVVALVGDDRAGDRGHRGLVGRSETFMVDTPTAHDIQTLFDTAPPNKARVVLLSYESGFANVHLPVPSAGNVPHVLVMDVTDGVIFDHQTGRHTSIGNGLDDIVPRFESQTASCGPSLDPCVDDKTHASRICRAQQHIEAGDIYQANITRQLRVQSADPLRETARHLCEINPVAHGAYLRAGDFELCSNSMETLLTYDPQSRTAKSYPIKGTRARASETVTRALSNDEKEAAEHVMIVDLVRSDLGRVCEVGSVGVASLMDTVPYAGVWHGVSCVSGTLAHDHTPGELVTSLFPGGSITGAPKRRAMQIIQELEQTPRGYYTGSLAVIFPDGSISMSILIRTLVRVGDVTTLGVGGGIVADSTPEREIQETWEKVSVFKRAFSRAAKQPAA